MKVVFESPRTPSSKLRVFVFVCVCVSGCEVWELGRARSVLGLIAGCSAFRAWEWVPQRKPSTWAQVCGNL